VHDRCVTVQLALTRVRGRGWQDLSSSSCSRVCVHACACVCVCVCMCACVVCGCMCVCCVGWCVGAAPAWRGSLCARECVRVCARECVWCVCGGVREVSWWNALCGKVVCGRRKEQASSSITHTHTHTHTQSHSLTLTLTHSLTHSQVNLQTAALLEHRFLTIHPHPSINPCGRQCASWPSWPSSSPRHLPASAAWARPLHVLCVTVPAADGLCAPPAAFAPSRAPFRRPPETCTCARACVFVGSVRISHARLTPFPVSWTETTSPSCARETLTG
jgi:hypothetical protein